MTPAESTAADSPGRDNFESQVRSDFETLSPAALTPLTGRDTEVALLFDRWEQAQEGMGQVVLLIGEAGLGASSFAAVGNRAGS